ncbi:MAG: hypothetical protein PHY14_00650 [Candidatus Gracilibacteria bacterium]|nr:hypothetical protein [Candidatus Gracilibacteria bacterium]
MKKYTPIFITIFLGFFVVGGYFLFSPRSHEEAKIIPSVSADSSLDHLSNLFDEHIANFVTQKIPAPNYTYEEQLAHEKAVQESIENLGTEYQKVEKSFTGFSGSIEFYDAPRTMNPLGFFRHIGSDTYADTYTESTGSYRELGTIHLTDHSSGTLFSLGTSAFYGLENSTFYFIAYNGEYYFLPSIPYTPGTNRLDTPTKIGKILRLKSQLQKPVHLFEEAKFLPIIGKSYEIPTTIKWKKDRKNYTLTFIGRQNIPFSSENLQKLDDLSKQVGKPLYIEKSGVKTWGDTEYQNIQNLFSTASGSEVFEKLDDATKQKYWTEQSQHGLFASDAIFMELPDHTVALYTLSIPFAGQKNPEESITINLRKNDGKRMILKDYGYQDSPSCGTKDGTYFNIPDGKFRFEEMYILDKKRRNNPEVWKDKVPLDIPASETIFTYQESDLTKIGIAGGREEIFSFKNQNHPFLRAMYDYGYMEQLDWQGCFDNENGANCRKPLTFKAYTKTLPVFFWRDPFGRFVMFISYSTIMPSACAAKPVIYLYPEKTENISVSLDWKKKLLTSIPEYGNGWNVIAEPDGTLFVIPKESLSKSSYRESQSLSSKVPEKEISPLHDEMTKNESSYPYLFWEDVISYPKPTIGFVVKQENIASFLDEKLSFLGLNEKEISDFTEYWIPNMKDKPYYRISFLGNREMQRSAPITITPTPESIQRIFMDFEGLDALISIPEQVLTPFVRTGFSAIEWGGKKQK